MANPASRVTADDYARAERFLSWNKDRYVINADIQHHWIGAEDRFWYLRRDAAGAKTFVVVDAVTGEKQPAFDQKKLAQALSKASGEPIQSERLPFESFRFLRAGAIQFSFAGKVWKCGLKNRPSCAAAAAVASSHEILSPDGKWVAFLEDHNIWVRPTSGGGAFALTSDGAEHYGYAGPPAYSTHAGSDIRDRKPARPQALWSPDSRFLLTHQLDERLVKDLFLVQAVTEDGSLRPRPYSYRYAMPGDEYVPLLQPVVLDVVARRAVKVSTPPMPCSALTSMEKRETWWSADSKTFFYLNRDRFSKSIGLFKSDPMTGAATRILQEHSETTVRVNGTHIFSGFPAVRTLSDGSLVWYSERDGWGHLYHYDSAGGLRNQITRGEWMVRSIVRVDETGKKLFFMGSGRESGRDPYEQSLYSIRLDGSDLRLLTPESADHEWPHPIAKFSAGEVFSTEMEKARFGASGRYFLDSYSRPDLPPVLVLRDAEGKLIKSLEQADVSRLNEGGYSPIESFEVLAADGKTPIYGNLFRPSTFSPSKRYPVIDASYPGPQIIRTAKNFTGANFDAFEARSLAELGCIVITIDGRGTPFRSRAFLDYSYGRLEKASDLDDHIAGIRQLAERYPYMDLDRVGIDGVSGGGYRAAQAILAYPDFFKVAVAAEGNHDQRGYLAPWGDTFNGPVGQSDYAGSSNLTLAGNLKGKLLLMHGDMDHNVSPTLTLKLVQALIEANKDFDLLILPNGNHDVFVTSPYFIRSKWDYFVRNLLQAEPPASYVIHRP